MGKKVGHCCLGCFVLRLKHFAVSLVGVVTHPGQAKGKEPVSLDGLYDDFPFSKSLLVTGSIHGVRKNMNFFHLNKTCSIEIP